MDYKYIEQLIQRYFACETTLQEEQILKAFFSQESDDMPEELRRWRPLFAALQPEEQLGDDFTRRIISLTTEARHVQAIHVSMAQRFRPLLKAAAMVAFFIVLTQALNFSVSTSQQANDDIDYADYKDTYDDPTMAFDQVEDALQLLSEGYSQARLADSTATAGIAAADTTQTNQ